MIIALSYIYYLRKCLTIVKPGWLLVFTRVCFGGIVEIQGL